MRPISFTIFGSNNKVTNYSIKIWKTDNVGQIMQEQFGNNLWLICTKKFVVHKGEKGFLIIMYTHAILWFPPSFLAVNHHNIKNWVPSILTNNLWLIFMGMKQKKIFFFEKKFKMADSKKLSFSTSPKAEQFPPKFHGLVFDLVELIDVKGIDFAQSICPWGWPTEAQKQAKMHFWCF